MTWTMKCFLFPGLGLLVAAETQRSFFSPRRAYGVDFLFVLLCFHLTVEIRWAEPRTA